MLTFLRYDRRPSVLSAHCGPIVVPDAPPRRQMLVDEPPATRRDANVAFSFSVLPARPPSFIGVAASPGRLAAPNPRHDRTPHTGGRLGDVATRVAGESRTIEALRRARRIGPGARLAARTDASQ